MTKVIAKTAGIMTVFSMTLTLYFGFQYRNAWSILHSVMNMSPTFNSVWTQRCQELQGGLYLSLTGSLFLAATTMVSWFMEHHRKWVTE